MGRDHNCKSLDKSIERENWKQWLPVYGVIQGIVDDIKSKPSVIRDTNHPIKYVGSAIYQGISIVGAYEGLCKLAEILF